MLVSTSLIGIIPMVCKVSERFMKLLSIYGAGLLVGAAFIIIIPEGLGTLIGSFTNINALDENASSGLDPEALSHNNVVNTHELGECVGLSMTFGFLLMLSIDEFNKSK
jgi:zinc transporter 9